MNIEQAVIEMPRYQAREAYVNYRTAIADKRATRDDVSLYRGLRALLRGTKVIDINLAMGVGGRDQFGRPRFAIVRANAPVTYCQGYGNSFRFSSNSWMGGRQPKGAIDISVTSFGALPLGAPSPWEVRCEAQTPSIPPQHRPAAGKLSDYHILFEAEWRKIPPVDPLLLKRIDGPFFAVLAAWNLTPLEQAILRQKLV